ncbi:hypothetical protein DRI50_04725 [candidate division KSB1 bacterium]|nr:MAG: hypothetical protein DRI50_04725 [candidate division KSB1 bacterium]
MSSASHEDRVFPTYPRVGVGVVLLRGKNVLLVKRGHEPAKGEWSIPGGLIHLGEGAEDAAHRELMEECGIRADIKKVIDIFELIEQKDVSEIKYHFVVIEFLAHYIGGVVKAASDAEEAGWFSLQDIDGMSCSNKVKELVRLAMNM